jgi:hypothetical protein
MTFFSYDEDEIDQDTRNVLSGSSILQITEFHLFELAYQRWFGEDASEQKIESYYTHYMFQQRVPFWVRQFCREVMEQDQHDALNPAEFGVFPVPVSATMVQRGFRLGLIVIFVIATLHLIAILVSNY